MESPIQQGIRLSDFTAMLQRSIQSLFGGQVFHVIGEISNLKIYESRKTLYFHLVEKSAEKGNVVAEMSCVGFSPAYNSLLQFESETGQKLGDGIEVLMSVRVDFQPTRGLKLHLLHIDSNYTIGLLQKQRQMSIERLLRENGDAVWLEGELLVTRNQKHGLPLAIRRIAVLSSEQSAGYQDFLHTLQENLQDYRFELTLFPVLVQGEANADALVKRLIEVYEASVRFDAVVIVRGGGSQTDLLLFDAYAVVRAIARFPIPVFTGLGHLKDISLADLVAHSALKTPTKVAEFIIDHNAMFEQRLIDLRQRLVLRTQRKLNTAIQLIDTRQNKLIGDIENLVSIKARAIDNSLNSARMHALNKIAKEQNRQSIALTQLQFFPRNFVQKAVEKLHGAESLVRAYGPETLLKRGFAYVKQSCKSIKNAAQLKKHENIELYFADGKAQAIIQTIEIYGKKERDDS
jgi:exodeoxyribonuclease VII large subunit